MKMPECADRDVRYYTLFICAIVLMIFSAVATVVCFQLEKQMQMEYNQTLAGVPSETPPSELVAALVPDGEKAHKEVRILGRATGHWSGEGSFYSRFQLVRRVKKNMFNTG